MVPIGGASKGLVLWFVFWTWLCAQSTSEDDACDTLCGRAWIGPMRPIACTEGAAGTGAWLEPILLAQHGRNSQGRGGLMVALCSKRHLAGASQPACEVFELV